MHNFKEKSHEQYMQIAISEAHQALKLGEVPVGAIMVCENRIIGRAHNLVERLNDATAHAEMLCMSSAFEHLGSKYLNQCTLYVTLEPCLMCAGASFWSQIGCVVYGAADPVKGAHSVFPKIFHRKTSVISDILAIQCEDLLREFFVEIR